MGYKNVKVSNDQEMTQSERNLNSKKKKKTKSEKNLDNQVLTQKEHTRKPSGQLFPNRLPGLTKYM